MVTHNPELAEQYSTRIIRLLDGLVVGEIPILPATETIAVRAPFDKRFLSESINAIPNDMEERFFLPFDFLTGSA